MKVKETVERECCQYKDLKPVEKCLKIGSDPSLMFCIHCGSRHEHTKYMDVAGSMDWEYRKVKE